MYTRTKPFPNFINLSGVNMVNICDVTFIGGGGGGVVSEKVTSVVMSLIDSP